MGTIATVVNAIVANLRSWPPFFPLAPRVSAPRVPPGRGAEGVSLTGGERYRVEATEWGAETAERPSRVRSFLDSLSPDEPEPEPRGRDAGAVGHRPRRLPEASALPSPRGLLTCTTDPRKQGLFRPRWAI